MDSNDRNHDASRAKRATLRTWGICGLLLLATMLMYMDRQALAQQKTEITAALKLSNTDYGRLELGFGLAFAVGGIVTGLLADRISPRWFYPVVLMGWSSVGFATGWVTSYWQFFACRVLLGFFEAGHWPCALVDRAAPALAPRPGAGQQHPPERRVAGRDRDADRRAAPGQTARRRAGGLPFRVIGALGIFWVVGWLSTIRAADLELKPSDAPSPAPGRRTGRGSTLGHEPSRSLARPPVPGAGDRGDHASTGAGSTSAPGCRGCSASNTATDRQEVQYFSIAYYVAADIGCLSVGFLVRWLAGRGLSVHGARMSVFAFCTLLTAMSTLVAILPASWLFLAVLLVVGFGSLGQFPMYYAFTQELSVSRMGTGHRHPELPHVDLDGPDPGADRPVGRPHAFVLRGDVRGRAVAADRAAGHAAALGSEKPGDGIRGTLS